MYPAHPVEPGIVGPGESSSARLTAYAPGEPRLTTTDPTQRW
jgi:hypothetical protein